MPKTKAKVWEELGAAIGRPAATFAKAHRSALAPMEAAGIKVRGGFGGGSNTFTPSPSYLAAMVLSAAYPYPSEAGRLVDDALKCICVAGKTTTTTLKSDPGVTVAQRVDILPLERNGFHGWSLLSVLTFFIGWLARGDEAARAERRRQFLDSSWRLVVEFGPLGGQMEFNQIQPPQGQDASPPAGSEADDGVAETDVLVSNKRNLYGFSIPTSFQGLLSPLFEGEANPAAEVKEEAIMAAAVIRPAAILAAANVLAEVMDEDDNLLNGSPQGDATPLKSETAEPRHRVPPPDEDNQPREANRTPESPDSAQSKCACVPDQGRTGSRGPTNTGRARHARPLARTVQHELHP